MQKYEKLSIPLRVDTMVADLNKLSVKIELDNVGKENTAESKKEVIRKSILHQVLTPFTAFVCVIKENAGVAIKEGYLLKMKNGLEGLSSLESSSGLLYIKMLTGKTI
jgi:hypothetical protein